MTEQEMREKIVEVLKKSREEWEIITPSIGILDEPRVDIEIDKLADALIAAGIGDVKEAEHRAEVAQLIAERACELVFSEEINDEDWVNVIFNYKKEKGIREIGITTNILYDYLKDQAEKELAEERKDD